MQAFYRNNRIFILLLGIVVAGFLIWYFSHIVIFVAVAAVIAIIGTPLVDLLDKIRIGRMKLPHTFNVVIALTLFLLLFLSLLGMFIPLIISETEMISNIDWKALTKHFSKDISSFEVFMRRNGVMPRGATLESTVKQSLVKILDFGMFGNLLSSLIAFTGNFFFNLFSITFLSFFFMKDRKMLPGFLIRITPARYVPLTISIMKKSRVLLSRYFIGLIIQIAANVLTYTLAFAIVGVSNPLVIGFFTGVIIIIPYIGGIIAMLVGVILGVTGVVSVGEYSLIFPMAIKILVAMFIVQTIDNNIFAPLIQGKSLKAHPVEVFLVVIAAASFGGIIGMVVAVPVYGFIKIVAGEIYINYVLMKRLAENR
jgi:predicted PurR-regulated permease PerM